MPRAPTRVPSVFLWRWQISSHEPFEELCVIAAAGEISAAEWQELNAHLAECEACRRLFREMTEIHANCVPDGFDLDHGGRSDADLLLRSKVLKRAAKAGARFSKRATNSLPSTNQPRGSLIAHLSRLFSHPSFSFAAGAFLALGIVGGFAWGLRGHTVKRQAAQMSGSLAANANVLGHLNSPDTGGVSSRASADSARREAELELALRRAQEERSRLARELADAQGKIRQIEQVDMAAARRVADLEQQLAASSAKEAETETELAKAREAHNADQIERAAQERAIRDLNSRLEQQSTAIDRESQWLSAGREIRDLIAARNLHIIDVYDTNGDGKTKKAFGRAFYTEGKSLIFYAYDLSAHRTENAKYAYYAWGKTDRNEHAIRSLGLMYNDDQTQKRWVLKITDPDTLARIDSVFITLERTDNPVNRPHGKEILSAYLRSPANHP